MLDSIVTKGLLGAIGVLVVSQAGTAALLHAKQGNIEKKAARIAELELQVAGYAAQEDIYERIKLQGEAAAGIAAAACQKTIQFRVKHTIESEEISHATSPDDAVSAYDRLLCQRPEAAGHPRCAELAQPPG